MSDMTRRSFLNASAGALAATSVLSSRSRAGVNETVRAAVLGVNGRGREHIAMLQKTPGVQVAVLCDPDDRVAAARAKECEQKYGHKPETVNDLRKVFDRKDVDVVTIATPNHWHALAAIWACQAGKDVYVEKPGSHNIFEGRKLVEAAEKYQRIVQHGVQLRSSPAIQEAVKHLRDGLIGNVYMARGLVFRWRPTIGHKQDGPAPDYLNWDLWQGPAQQREFSQRLVHYNWHWHWNYGNGDVGNQGVHETDMCQWGLDVQLPSQIVAMGGKFLWDDDKETPEVLIVQLLLSGTEPDDRVRSASLVYERRRQTRVGNIFYGSEGYLVVRNYGSYESFLGRNGEPGPKNSAGGELELHFANFIEAVRTRNKDILNGPVETAHYSSGLAHLGNIAFRLGRQLRVRSENRGIRKRS